MNKAKEFYMSQIEYHEKKLNGDKELVDELSQKLAETQVKLHDANKAYGNQRDFVAFLKEQLESLDTGR